MATKQPTIITKKTSVVNINSPAAMATFATQLKTFIVKNQLYTGIKNKNFVHVEGWQFAGASMGIFPIIDKVEDLSKDNEIKYRAEVRLVQISTDQTVGFGVATCSNKETTKKSFDEYAIVSMAQTRAVSKAFRLSIGWVMKLAGYESTPAEEATKDMIDDPTVNEPTEPEVPIEEVKALVQQHIATLAPTDKVRFLKEGVGVMTDKSLDDGKYRRLYDFIMEARENQENDNEQV